MNPSCMATTHFAPPADAKLSSLLGQLIEALPLPGKLLGLCHKLEFEQHFPLTAHGYSRTILHRKKNGAEAMVARWDKGAATPIHGHPHLAFVYLLEGRLQIDNFDQHNGQLHVRETVVLEPGDHIWNRGKAGHFDNAIHRVTALESSLSLHLYSDDALKGETY